LYCTRRATPHLQRLVLAAQACHLLLQLTLLAQQLLQRAAQQLLTASLSAAQPLVFLQA
jgi:predicted Rdx family selenoprotein